MGSTLASSASHTTCEHSMPTTSSGDSESLTPSIVDRSRLVDCDGDQLCRQCILGSSGEEAHHPDCQFSSESSNEQYYRTEDTADNKPKKRRFEEQCVDEGARDSIQESNVRLISVAPASVVTPLKESEQTRAAASRGLFSIDEIPIIIDELRESTTNAPMAVEALMLEIARRSPRFVDGSNKLVDTPENVFRLEQFRRTFGGMTYTMPEYLSLPKTNPNPAMVALSGVSLTLCQWEILLAGSGERLKCIRCAHGDLLNVGLDLHERSSTVGIMPILEHGRKPHWITHATYQCNQCKQRVWGGDPKLIQSLPPRWRLRYPCDTRWTMPDCKYLFGSGLSQLAKSCMIDRRLGAVFVKESLDISIVELYRADKELYRDLLDDSGESTGERRVFPSLSGWLGKRPLPTTEDIQAHFVFAQSAAHDFATLRKRKLSERESDSIDVSGCHPDGRSWSYKKPGNSKPQLAEGTASAGLVKNSRNSAIKPSGVQPYKSLTKIPGDKDKSGSRMKASKSADSEWAKEYRRKLSSRAAIMPVYLPPPPEGWETALAEGSYPRQQVGRWETALAEGPYPRQQVGRWETALAEGSYPRQQVGRNQRTPLARLPKPPLVQYCPPPPQNVGQTQWISPVRLPEPPLVQFYPSGPPPPPPLQQQHQPMAAVRLMRGPSEPSARAKPKPL